MTHQAPIFRSSLMLKNIFIKGKVILRVPKRFYLTFVTQFIPDLPCSQISKSVSFYTFEKTLKTILHVQSRKQMITDVCVDELHIYNCPRYKVSCMQIKTNSWCLLLLGCLCYFWSLHWNLNLQYNGMKKQGCQQAIVEHACNPSTGSWVPLSMHYIKDLSS